MTLVDNIKDQADHADAQALEELVSALSDLSDEAATEARAKNRKREKGGDRREADLPAIAPAD